MFSKAQRRLSPPASLLPGIARTAILALVLPVLVTARVHHYEYVFPDGSIHVYDADNGFNLVKTIAVPTSTGTRGAVASAATGMLYVSYGPDRATGGSLLKYDLTTDQVVWTMTYPFGVDSMSISPDGKTLYMPTGEANTGSGLWKVIDAGSGAVTGEINSGGVAPHNTVLNLKGSHVYLGPRFRNYLVEVDSSTLQAIRSTGPVGGTGGVRPFTINGKETLAFITLTGYLGFQVADLTSGAILFTVPISGFLYNGTGPSCPSHGVSISPDEKELYVVDAPNSYVHVYDITGLPGSPPVQVANLALAGSLSGHKSPCAYDCLREGWLHHSRDGHYVFVGDAGDVIDTGLRRTVATLPAMKNSRVEIEIDFQNGAVVWAMANRNSIGAVTASNAPAISTTSLPSGAVDTAYMATPAATGGATPYTWSVTSGTLPAGLTLAANTGVISGTPTVPGTSNFTVQVTDASSMTASKALSITVKPAGGGGIAGASQLYRAFGRGLRFRWIPVE